MRRYLLHALLALAVFGPCASAQAPATGDFLLVHAQFIYAMNRTSGGYITLRPPTNLPPLADYRSVALAENNRDLVLGLTDGAATPSVDSVVRWTPGATKVTTLAGFAAKRSFSRWYPPPLCLDQDGDSYFTVTHETVGSLTIGRVVRVRSSGGISTLATISLSGSANVADMIVDPATDRALFGIPSSTTTEVREVDLRTGVVTTFIRAAPARPMAVEPATGHLIGASASGIVVFDRSGATIATIAHPSSIAAIRVEAFTGTFLVGDDRGKFGSVVTEYSPGGKALRSWRYVTGLLAFEVYGSRHVSGAGSAKPGTSYSVRFSFPDMAGAVYVGALSLARRPGIPIGGGTIHLAPDGLFFASLAGALTRSFSGTLDSRGTAQGTVTIPPAAPPGLTFYCAAVAVSGNRTQVGDSIGVTIRP